MLRTWDGDRRQAHMALIPINLMGSAPPQHPALVPHICTQLYKDTNSILSHLKKGVQTPQRSHDEINLLIGSGTGVRVPYFLGIPSGEIVYNSTFISNYILLILCGQLFAQVT